MWLLACAAITLQTVRHLSDFTFGAGQTKVVSETEQPPLEQPRDAAGEAAAGGVRRAPRALPVEEARPAAPAPRLSPARRFLRYWTRIDRKRPVYWFKQMIAFPIGERFAAISITAALFDARVTFIVLLTWGGIAATYSFAGRVLRSLR